MAFSPGGKTIAAAVSGLPIVSDFPAYGTVRLWDVSTGTMIAQPLTGHTDAVHSVAFSPDGKTGLLQVEAMFTTLSGRIQASGVCVGNSLVVLPRCTR